MHTPVRGVATPTQLGVGFTEHNLRLFLLTRDGCTGDQTSSVEVISEQFAGKSMVARHRLVYDTLDGEMVDGGIHALALKTKTPTEMAKTSPSNP